MCPTPSFAQCRHAEASTDIDSVGHSTASCAAGSNSRRGLGAEHAEGGLDAAHGAGLGAQHHGLGLGELAAEVHPIEQRAVGHAGGREDHVAGGHLVHGILAPDVGDAHGLHEGHPVLEVGDRLQVQDDAVVTFSDLTDAGTIELGGGTSVNDIAIQGTRAITLDPTSGHQVVVAGTISDEVGTGAGPGVGSVIATGGGYVELDGVDNSFTGGVTVTGSGTTLAISDDANLGNGGTLALGSGTTLELFFGAAPAYTITHTITVAGDAIFKLDHGVAATFAGVITDGASPGTVELTGDPLGAETLVLANSNTYTGGTIIGSGTLEIAAMQGAGTGGITFAPLADPTHKQFLQG